MSCTSACKCSYPLTVPLCKQEVVQSIHKSNTPTTVMVTYSGWREVSAEEHVTAIYVTGKLHNQVFREMSKKRSHFLK